MRFQDVMSSKPAVQIGLFIGQHMPSWVGYGIARIAANLIARRKPENYWTVRANLCQVVGPGVDDETLHEMVCQVFAHAGRVYYDFFHATGLAQEELVRAARVPGPFVALMKAEIEKGRGALVLGLHMSGFDLAMVAIGAHGVPIHALSLADPGPGFQIQNRLRVRAGIEVTPITPESLRLAIRRLRSGWTVFTGADRPVPEEQELIEFFGRPAHLPLGPVRMALITGAVVLVASCHYDPDAGYVVRFTGPVEMVRTGSRRQDIRANARRVALTIEEHVRAHPEQWLMFHRVWPESSSESVSLSG